MNYYSAFSLTIASEPELPLLVPTGPCGDTDITITFGDLSEYEKKASSVSPQGYWFYHGDAEVAYNTEEGAGFLIRGGDTIVIDSPESVHPELLQVYVLGGCLGTAINQRGILALHGSCVTKGGRTLLITGESGAGKSTLAHEFIENGWEILTDDVSAISFDGNGEPFVVPSYPSQKMWQDAIDRYEVPDGDLTSLWQEERREKFNVDITKSFHNQKERLNTVVWLLKAKEDYDGPCVGQMISGFPVVDRLMRNTYRGYCRDTKGKNLLFQQCVNLAPKIGLLTVFRPVGRNTGKELYELIINKTEVTP